MKQQHEREAVAMETQPLLVKVWCRMFLTWHHAIKGDGALANEVLTNGIMIPHQETH